MQKWDLLCGEQRDHMRLAGVQKLIASIHIREIAPLKRLLEC
jgi:hypothetical protein